MSNIGCVNKFFILLDHFVAVDVKITFSNICRFVVKCLAVQRSFFDGKNYSGPSVWPVYGLSFKQ